MFYAAWYNTAATPLPPLRPLPPPPPEFDRAGASALPPAFQLPPPPTPVPITPAIAAEKPPYAVGPGPAPATSKAVFEMLLLCIAPPPPDVFKIPLRAAWGAFVAPAPEL